MFRFYKNCIKNIQWINNILIRKKYNRIKKKTICIKNIISIIKLKHIRSNKKNKVKKKSKAKKKSKQNLKKRLNWKMIKKY